MRLRHIAGTFAAIAVLCAAAVTSPAQGAQAPAPQSDVFAPLARWRAAVLAGNAPATRALYLDGSGNYAKTPEGQTADLAATESAFWAAMRAAGLTAIAPKILQRSDPQPGEVALVLRVEMTFRDANGATRHALISVAQVWAASAAGAARNAAANAPPNPADGWRIVIERRLAEEPLPTYTLPQPATPNTHLYADPAEGPRDLAAALAAAKKDGRRVLVVFGANWCYDCHVLDAALRSPALAPLVAANYHVVHISIGEGKDNADMAARFQVPLDKGIPSLAVLDASGVLITSQKNGEFEESSKIGMSDVSAFLNQWKPPAPAPAPAK